MFIEFEVGKVQYRSAKMDAFIALHVARRIAPIAGQLFMARTGILSPEAMVLPLMAGIAQMKDEDFDYVRDACLHVVERKDGDNWRKLYNKQAKMLQYQDLRPKQVLEIVISVVQDNLADFLDDLPLPASGGETQAGQSSPP